MFLCSATSGQNGGSGPVLFYSDLDSGPATGGEDGKDGAFLCVYGENFGAVRGASALAVGGTVVAAYKLWFDPGAPYKPGHYAKACGQISHATPAGANVIQLTTLHGSSNTLPFIVRPGKIYFVVVNGQDKTGNGSSRSPWRTINRCRDAMNPGDICCVGDGVTVTAVEPYRESLLLSSSGEAGLPKAIVGYPGGKVTIDNSANPEARSAVLNRKPRGGSSSYWTLAGLTLNSNQVALQLLPGAGFRIVDNDLMCSGAGCNAPTGGVIAGAGMAEFSDVKFYGNRIHDIGCHDDADYRKSAHPCAWIKTGPQGFQISTSGTAFTLSRWPGSFSPGTDILANGQIRKVVALPTGTNGRLDAAFSPDLPPGTVYQYRFPSPIKLYHDVYFGYVHDLDFAWNEIDGRGQACRALQFHSTNGYDSYDLHVHDNLIHHSACDCMNFSTVDPSRGVVEVYNNVLHSCGTDSLGGMNSSFAGIYVSNSPSYGSLAPWYARHAYAAGDLVDDGSHMQKCAKAGISMAAPGRPAWNPQSGGSTADGTVVWQNAGAAHRRSGQIQFFNNTIYNAGLGGQTNWNTACWALLASGGTTSPTIGLAASNNVCLQPNVNGQSYAFFIDFDANRKPAGSYVSGTNNLFYGLSAAPCNAIHSPTVDSRGCPQTLVNNLSMDPKFVNAREFDFHPAYGSPLRQAGAALGKPHADQDGIVRRTKPSIGAYE